MKTNYIPERIREELTRSLAPEIAKHIEFASVESVAHCAMVVSARIMLGGRMFEVTQVYSHSDYENK